MLLESKFQQTASKNKGESNFILREMFGHPSQQAQVIHDETG